MNRTIDEIYLGIAQAIVDSIEGKWDVAKVEVEYIVNTAEFDCVYVDANSKAEKDFDVGYQMYKDFKELHGITTEGGSNPWNRASFTLNPDGEFSIDFKWDEELAQEFED
jgi:hypothetical protein